MPNDEPTHFDGGALRSESESCERYGLRPKVVRKAMALFQQRKTWRSVLAELEACRLIERKPVTKAAVQSLVCEYYRDDILRLAERGVSMKGIQTALKRMEKVDVGMHAVRDCVNKGPRPRHQGTPSEEDTTPRPSGVSLRPASGLARWSDDATGWGLDPTLNQNSQDILGDASQGLTSRFSSPGITVGCKTDMPASTMGQYFWPLEGSQMAPMSPY